MTSDQVRARMASGDLAGARALARAWVTEAPGSAEAWNALGHAEVVSGDATSAERSFRKALEIEPTLSKALSNLGACLRTLGRVDEAIAALRAAVELEPRNARAWTNLGNALRLASRADDAALAYRTALAIEPSAAACFSLATLLRERGHRIESLALLERALSLGPAGALGVNVRNALASELLDLGRVDEALALFPATEAAFTVSRAQLLLRTSGPRLARAQLDLVAPPRRDGAFWSLMSEVLERSGDAPGADAAAREAAARAPSAATLCELARREWRRGDRQAVEVALSRAEAAEPGSPAPALLRAEIAIDHGDLGSAEAALDAAERRAPALLESLSHRAKIAAMRGDPETAVALLRDLVERNPTHRELASNLLLTLHYVETTSLLREHLAWSARHVPLAATPGFDDNALRPRGPRKIRIGYLSADLREHAVARFFAPLLAAHDRERFEVFLYATSERVDATTRRLMHHAHGFRQVGGASVAEVVGAIRADAIDVLVDLGGHTSQSGVHVLGHRPAPVLASFLGYPDTTGIAAVDLRITDAEADPPGEADRHVTEELVRLPRCAWCFEPAEDAPAVEPRDGEGVVYGVFNNASKLSRTARAAFSEVLRRSPSSRLLIKSRAIADERSRAALLAPFERAGVADRVILRAWTGDHRSHLATYAEVDVALDTFPYAGTTTTCEALWMGVPVVTWAGATHASRVGASLLRAVGLEASITTSFEAFVARSVELGADRAARRELRRTLRAKMIASDLRRADSLAAHIESVFTARVDAWRSYAAKATDPGVWLALADGSVLHAPDRATCATRFLLEAWGDWVEPEIDLVRRLLDLGGRAADVGAGLGVYTIPMARRVGPMGRVLAFEREGPEALHLVRSAVRCPAASVHFVPDLDAVELDAHADDLAGVEIVVLDGSVDAARVMTQARRLRERNDPLWMVGTPTNRAATNDLVAAASEAMDLAALRWDASSRALVAADGVDGARVFFASPARCAALSRRSLLRTPTDDGDAPARAASTATPPEASPRGAEVHEIEARIASARRDWGALVACEPMFARLTELGALSPELRRVAAVVARFRAR